MTTVEDLIAEGQLIRLRRKRLADAEDDFEWRRDPELARFDAAAPLRGTFQEFYTSFQDEVRLPSPFRRVLSVDDLDGHHIGNVMYYNIDERRGEAELGITIGDKRYWNQGYGTDILRTFLRYLFTEQHMTRIYLHTLDWNVRAQRSFQKAGFRSLGITRRGLHTFVQMEVRREEFLGNDER